MPYEKIYISHKFGIISQNHKRMLQERLLERRLKLEKSAQQNRKNDESINLQITEDFVKEYNESGIEKKFRLDQQCLKMFEKIKKKLNSQNIDDLGVQLAWAELSQLCQCSSPLRDDCLDLFIDSLNFARLSDSQMPTLFFLAETVIYWIRTDIVNQPFLRAFELKLLKISYLIFHRIYFHYLDESLDNQDDLKEHLSIYLHGFEECLNAYSPYPDALFYMTFVVKVGDILKKSIGQNSSETNKSISEILNSNDLNSNNDGNHLENNEQMNLESNLKSNIIENSDYLIGSNESVKEKYTNQVTSLNFIRKKVSSLPPFLKHTIILFNYLNNTKIKADNEQLDYYLNNVLECSSQITNQDSLLIESVYAFCILGECSKINLNALHVFLSISCSSFIEVNENTDYILKSNSNNNNSKNKIVSIESWNWELACLYVEILADIAINSNNINIKKKALYGFHNDEVECANQLKSRNRSDLIGYGLIDAARFQLSKTRLNSEEDWSWKVRYTAIKALVKICKCFNKEYEQLRRICLSFLVIFEESEKNQNVLEAIQVGQASEVKKNNLPKIKSKLNENKQQITSTYNTGKLNIFCQLSNRFYDLLDDREKNYLFKSAKSTNSLSDNKTLFSFNMEDNKNETLSKNNFYQNLSTNSSNAVKNFSSSNDKNASLNDFSKKRTTLMEELTISNQFQNKIPSYFNRKNFDLMRIVEDQYRKEEIQNFENQLKENTSKP